MMNLNLVVRLLLVLSISSLFYSFSYIKEQPYVVILGIAQDGGAPHAACEKTCCIDKWNDPNLHNKVSSIGIVDPVSNEVWMIDATPDFAEQLHLLTNNNKRELKGIFLTHAHIGHYTGLIHLGREVMGAKSTVVNVMHKMESFLRNNGPWSQLVDLKNISLSGLSDNKKVQLNSRLSIIPFKVPHRDEFSETVGYKIYGPNKTALFIPDIDKWYLWEKSIIDEIKKVDYAFIDATFFDNAEVNYRDISEIPHPFIVESMQLFESLSPEEKSKIHFIHFNHTNPALNPESEKYKMIIKKGFKVARFGATLKL